MDSYESEFWRRAADYQRRQLWWTRITNSLVLALLVTLVVLSACK